MQFKILGIVTAVILTTSPTLATPRSHQSELEKTKEAIAATHERVEATQKDMKEVEADLQTLQKTLVALTADVQKTERELSELEDKQAALSAEREEKLNRYHIKREQMAAVLAGMIRLSHTPAEAVVAMPGDFMDGLRTAQVLHITTQTLRKDAEMLTQQLADLEDIQKELAENKQLLNQRKFTLDGQQEELSGQIKERGQLQASLLARSQSEEDELKRLTRKSSSLVELMKNLENSRARTLTGYQTASLTPPTAVIHGEGRSFADAKGKIRLPVAGKISSFYGESKQKNETSRGITILTRAGAPVVAPFDGEVAFTGPFLDYGKMVILRHNDAYHTLLAGLDRIDCVVGQKVMQGEPIGVAGAPEGVSKDGGQVYLELRLKNNPVDPAPWMDHRT